MVPGVFDPQPLGADGHASVVADVAKCAATAHAHGGNRIERIVGLELLLRLGLDILEVFGRDATEKLNLTFP